MRAGTTPHAPSGGRRPLASKKLCEATPLVVRRCLARERQHHARPKSSAGVARCQSLPSCALGRGGGAVRGHPNSGDNPSLMHAFALEQQACLLEVIKFGPISARVCPMSTELGPISAKMCPTPATVDQLLARVRPRFAPEMDRHACTDQVAVGTETNIGLEPAKFGPNSAQFGPPAWER